MKPNAVTSPSKQREAYRDSYTEPESESNNTQRLDQQSADVEPCIQQPTTSRNEQGAGENALQDQNGNHRNHRVRREPKLPKHLKDYEIY